MRPPTAVTNAISWRSEGIKYNRNELFLDIVEHLSYVIGADGSLVTSGVSGSILMKPFLSGMPEVKLALSSRLQWQRTDSLIRGPAAELPDVKFHQCVRMPRFEEDGVLSFIPPNHGFSLMDYELPAARQPFRLSTAVRPGSESGRTEYVVSLTTNFKSTSTAQKVEVRVPLPKDASDVRPQASHGSAASLAEDGECCVVWQIDSLPSGRECELGITFDAPPRRFLPPVRHEPPAVGIQFQLPGYTASAMELQYVKIIEKVGYKATNFIRYSTTGVDCRHRIPH